LNRKFLRNRRLNQRETVFHPPRIADQIEQDNLWSGFIFARDPVGLDHVEH
jgi:hypothetical protein